MRWLENVKKYFYQNGGRKSWFPVEKYKNTKQTNLQQASKQNVSSSSLKNSPETGPWKMTFVSKIDKYWYVI